MWVQFPILVNFLLIAMWTVIIFASRGLDNFVPTCMSKCVRQVIRTRKMTTMRQVTLHSPGPSSALVPELVSIDLSDTPSEGLARVRVAACAIAYRDIIDRNGTRRETIFYHYILK